MDELGILWIGALVLTIYFIPSMVTMARSTERKNGIIVLNIFLGWSLLGWVGAFIWAVIDKKKENN